MGNGSKFSFIQHILRHVFTLLDVLIRNQGFFYIMYRFQLSQTIITLFFRDQLQLFLTRYQCMYMYSCIPGGTKHAP